MYVHSTFYCTSLAYFYLSYYNIYVVCRIKLEVEFVADQNEDGCVVSILHLSYSYNILHIPTPTL